MSKTFTCSLTIQTIDLGLNKRGNETPQTFDGRRGISLRHTLGNVGRTLAHDFLSPSSKSLLEEVPTLTVVRVLHNRRTSGGSRDRDGSDVDGDGRSNVPCSYVYPFHPSSTSHPSDPSSFPPEPVPTPRDKVTRKPNIKVCRTQTSRSRTY